MQDLSEYSNHIHTFFMYICIYSIINKKQKHAEDMAMRNHAGGVTDLGYRFLSVNARKRSVVEMLRHLKIRLCLLKMTNNEIR